MAGADGTDQIDCSAFSVTTLSAQSNDREYWQSRTPEERLAAVEQVRRFNDDYDPAGDRLQSVREIASDQNVRYLIVGGYVIGSPGHLRTTSIVIENRRRAGL